MNGRAAKILGIRKSELIDIYDKLGYSYFDMTMDDLDTELETYRQLKKGQWYDRCIGYNTINIISLLKIGRLDLLESYSEMYLFRRQYIKN